MWNLDGPRNLLGSNSDVTSYNCASHATFRVSLQRFSPANELFCEFCHAVFPERIPNNLMGYATKHLSTLIHVGPYCIFAAPTHLPLNSQTFVACFSLDLPLLLFNLLIRQFCSFPSRSGTLARLTSYTCICQFFSLLLEFF